MNPEEIRDIVSRQKTYFASGITLPVEFRISALRRLQDAIRRQESEIMDALQADLGKSTAESYMCEVGIVLSEISFMLKHVRSYARENRVRTPLAQYVSRSYVKPSPYGVVLIMSPWNYPFMLTLDPLVDALAAGNTAVIKPSAYSPRTSAVLQSLIAECFEPDYVAVITGGRAENQHLLKESFDYMFFTGSPAVGKEVMRHAAENLTPVTLELGGKSPCVVTKSAKLKLAARRIVFGKFLNCGQTCVAPDYIYCDAAIKEELVRELIRETKRQYSIRALANPDYGKIINEKHFRRICGLIDPDKVVYGGGSDSESLRIEPTILTDVTWDDAVMQEEIFGPVLPILTYDELDDALEIINSRPHPLAFYLFTEDKAEIRYVTDVCSFGGGCINDTIIHLATSNMGFGGVGNSGMGSYHGKAGFDTFSHKKSIVDKKTWLDLPMRYQPYTDFYNKMIRMFLR
ncbi:MAG: aldehyde dehydrogenase [Butyricicoccus sp.]|jgi:acyl-CoA reductase-like NAD-dependent aldehyde dehydrogenase